MKKLLRLTQSVMLAIGLVGIAHAHGKNWTGFYVGANTGFAFNDTQLSSQQLGFTSLSETDDLSSNFSTFFPGIQLGYLYKFSHAFVSGVEANVTFNTNQKNTFNGNSVFNSSVYDRFIFKNQLQTSIKGRFGRSKIWHKNRFLPYLTVGASLAEAGLTYENEGGNYYSSTMTDLGWLVGAGMEWAFRRHWSLRAEYYFVDYGKVAKLQIPAVYGLNDPNGNATVNLNSNNIAVAINYWI